MNDSSKVVSLAEKSGRRDTFARNSAPLPATALALRDRARELLVEPLKQVFAKVDDSLFSMAERAHGQEEQDGLFQALRLLRVERRSIAGRFATNVDEGFHVQPAAGEEEVTPDNLALVNNEDLEQLVAVDTMVANARRDYAEPVAELSLRLDTLYAVKIYDKNNPLGPDAICQAFVEAVHPLDIHIRARLTLLKKFEQLVMLQLKGVYEHCNQLMVEQGVLPFLREQRRIARQRHVAPPSGGISGGIGTTNGGHNAPGGEVPGGVWQGGGVPGGVTGPASGTEMAVAGASTGGAVASPGGNWAPGLLPATAGLAPMPAGDLLTHLGELQAGTQHYQSADEIQLLNVGRLLQQRLVQANQSASLAKADSDIIKLVEMLFSFILEDRNLAEPIKAQLGRLQLPLLKVAIADKSFFSKGGHPARKLLNQLADASTGWQAGEDYESDPLYREVSRLVDRVLNEFEQDVNIFSLLLESFRRFMERERKRAETLERRVVDEADGRARSQAARARVAAVMDALIAERELPSVVQDWLNKVWHKVLFLTCVKEGTDSEAWSRDVRTARDLVWSVQAPMPDNRPQLLALLPTLQERLRVGVEAVSLNPFEARNLFAGLKTVYGERFALAKRLTEERERLAAEQLEQRVEESRQRDEQDEREPGEADTAAAESTPQEVVEAPQPVVLPQMEELREAVAQAGVAAPESRGDTLESLPESDPHWQMTFRLAQGSWFELKRSEEERFRCRLAAVIRDIDQFIFVNRNGAKVAEFSRLQLAHTLRGAELMPLDDGMLFERALQSVIGTVRKRRETQTEG